MFEVPRMIPTPEQLHLKKTLEFIDIPAGKTFVYRGKIHRVIMPANEDSHLFREAAGPFIYAVTDAIGNVRYVGKSWEDRLYKRWIRPTPYIRHKESRDYIIREIEKGGISPALWSIPIRTLCSLVQNPMWRQFDDRTIAKALEALWIDRWGQQLWNSKAESRVVGFDDGEYWRA